MCKTTTKIRKSATMILKVVCPLFRDVLNATESVKKARIECTKSTTMKNVKLARSNTNHLWFLYPRQLFTKTQWWSNF